MDLGVPMAVEAVESAPSSSSSVGAGESTAGLAERGEVLLQDLVDMAQGLKGVASNIHSTVRLQNRELESLGDVAEDNRDNLGVEAKALTKYYKNSSSFFATLFRSIAVLVAFVFTVLFMAFFSKRF